MIKEIGMFALGALIALIVFHKFLKEPLGLNAYENLDDLDEE